LELASGSDEAEEADSDAPFVPPSKRKRIKKSTGKDGETAVKKGAGTRKKNKNESINETASKPKKAAAKKKPSNISNSSSSSDGNNIPAGGEPDGNGGLNQPAPFNVEYSKSSRATCRTCDEIIKKGDVRVGHTPLFRGKVSDDISH
jgi:hypothetical protein